MVFRLLCTKRSDFDPLLVLIGTVLLAAGIAYALSVTVIYVSFLMGLVLANGRPRYRDLYPSIASFEHPFYLLFLVIAGVLWNPGNVTAFIIALAVILLRFSGKWITFHLSRNLYQMEGWKGNLALALMAPSGISVAMIVNSTVFSSCFPLVNLALDSMVWVLIILNPLGVPLAKRALGINRTRP